MVIWNLVASRFLHLHSVHFWWYQAKGFSYLNFVAEVTFYSFMSQSGCALSKDILIQVLSPRMPCWLTTLSFTSWTRGWHIQYHQDCFHFFITIRQNIFFLSWLYQEWHHDLSRHHAAILLYSWNASLWYVPLMGRFLNNQMNCLSRIWPCGPNFHSTMWLNVLLFMHVYSDNITELMDVYLGFMEVVSSVIGKRASLTQQIWKSLQDLSNLEFLVLARRKMCMMLIWREK